MDDDTEQDDEGCFVCSNTCLGMGASKLVYRGFDRLHGKEVAWAKSFGSNGLNESKFDEVRIMTKVSHPLIVKLLKAWVNKEGDLIIVTDLYGYPLSEFLKQTGTQETPVLRKWARQILSALRYLHDEAPQPIAHRDIKPSNVFLNNYTGDVAIGDLGFSVIVSNERRHSIIGTAAYMAPEVLKGSHNHMADIYSFGMLLLEIGIQKPPYAAIRSIGELQAKVLKGELPDDELQLVQNSQLRDPILCCLREESHGETAATLRSHQFFSSQDDQLKPYHPTRYYQKPPTLQLARYNSL
jgi:serine/threonine protein kinase